MSRQNMVSKPSVLEHALPFYRSVLAQEAEVEAVSQVKDPLLVFKLLSQSGEGTKFEMKTDLSIAKIDNLKSR